MQASCAECRGDTEGELFLYPTERALAGDEVEGLCARCFSGKPQGEGCVVITRRASGAPAESPVERFRALFKAARVLLREQISDEDKIIPTLRLARTRGWREPLMHYDGVRVENVVEGIPILERIGVRVRGRRSLHTGALTDFAISLFARSKKVTAGEVANAYEQALTAEGVEWGKVGGRMTYDLHLIRGYYVLLTVERSPSSSMRKEEGWPPPSLVGKVARAALEEFSGRLVVRRAGNEMQPHNLIPAYVAYLMKHPLQGGAEVEAWGDILRLINQHVLGEVPQKSLPEAGYASTTEVVQFQRDVKKIAKIEERIPGQGPYELK